VTAPALRYRALLLGAATLFSTGGAAIKWVTLSGWQIACFRSGIASVVLLVAIPEARRHWHWRIVPVAGAYAATLITFVLANRLTTSADAIFLQFTAPFYLLLLGPRVLHESVRRADILYMAAVAAGMAVFFVGSEAGAATAPDPRKGNIIAASSGLSYALMLLGLRWLARREGGNAAVATVALGNLLASLIALPMALPIRSIAGHDVAVLLYLGVVQIGLAYVCLTRAMGHVPALQAATLLAVEPALNPVWTLLIHGERPGVWPLAGGAVILGATLINTWRAGTAAA
jgi:drug/metabolite transporter (DMT)-like permease